MTYFLRFATESILVSPLSTDEVVTTDSDFMGFIEEMHFPLPILKLEVTNLAEAQKIALKLFNYFKQDKRHRGLRGYRFLDKNEIDESCEILDYNLSIQYQQRVTFKVIIKS